MRVFTTLTMALVAAGLAASCDDDAEFGSACEHYSSVFCNKFTECYGHFDNLIGDAGTCTDRFTQSCEAGMALDGVLATPEDLDTCATVFEETTCDQLTNALIVQCLPLLKGDKPDGSACSTGMQCQGGECDYGDGNCGVCVTHPGAGEACVDRCQLGLACINMTCQTITFSGLGEPCGTGGAGCSPLYVCNGSVCEERKGQGEPCTGPECQVDLQCDMASDTCQPRPPPAALGEPCQGGLQCVYDAYCEEGVCQPRVPDGEACTDSSECYFGARCDGVCTLEPPVCN